MGKAIIITLFVSALTFNSVCQIRETVPIVVKNNRTYVTIRIGDLLIPDILLDTGFGFDGILLFKESYKDSLDVTKAMEVQMGGAGSGDAAKAIMIDSANLTLGNTEMINHPIIILQRSSDFASNGIIGYSIFGHFITEFDYDHNTMTLYSDKIETDTTWTTIPLYFKENSIPWLDASIVIENEEPISLSMYIDFAAGDEIVLLEKPDMKFTLPKETQDIYIGRGLSGDIYGKSGTISKLIIGPYEMQNINASIASAKIRSKQEDADAILGNKSLSRFNLIFDYENSKLYLKPNTHFREAVN